MKYCEEFGIQTGAASRLFVYYGIASYAGRLVSGRLCAFEKQREFVFLYEDMATQSWKKSQLHDGLYYEKFWRAYGLTLEPLFIRTTGCLTLIRFCVPRLSDDEERNFLRHFSPAFVFVHCFIYWSLSRNFTEAHQPVRSRSTAKRKNENLGNMSEYIENRICMKVEIHGYPYVCKYSILLFFFDDRNSVCDRIMLAPSFPNVTLHEKHVLRWTHITMTRSAIGSKWNDTAASEQRRVRWHD